MEENQLNVLYHVYHRTQNNSIITIEKIETETGISSYELRNLLEDLKEKGFVVELDKGFIISDAGILFSRSRWV